MFPILIPEYADQIQREFGRKDESLFKMRKEKLLFVDDEQSIIIMYKRVLSKHGYDIITTTDSLKALEIFRKESDSFDLVITDQFMPNLTGLELTAKLKEIRSDIPVLLCTGYSEDINAEKAESLGIREMLLKPFTIHDLMSVIRRILEESTN